MKAARVTCFLLFALLPLMLARPGATRAASSGRPNPFCQRLGTSIGASSGAYMYCFGPQSTGPGGAPPALSPLSSNEDAASLAEDVTPAGVRVYGQSETSIAASGPYVVEAWNDATGFFAPCPSPQNKEELTGFGFSADGGASFRDMGGIPNTNCSTYKVYGDPSVAAWTSGGATYFYISSLFLPLSGGGPTFIAMSACTVHGGGAAATLQCSQPIRMAQSTECQANSSPPPPIICSFLDKDFLALDPLRGRLYVSVTDFGTHPTSPLVNGRIELAVCDIGTPAGGRGPAGGTAAAPACTQPSPTGKPAAPPYFVVQPANANCENEGAYPAVDEATGDVYVAWEFNWATNTGPPIGPTVCTREPTQDEVARVPVACLTLTPTSPCDRPSATAATRVVSIDAAFIPGYNRTLPGAPGADFPRIAVSDRAGTVSIVWNDTRRDPLGDILLQSYTLGSLAPVQAAPVRLNGGSDDRANALHLMPALRSADQDGLLDVSWYDRRLAPSTGFTDVFAALRVDPRIRSTPDSNVRVTTVASNWLADSSDIIPNFGDYTDNYIISIPQAPFHGGELFVAWSDGRLGEPQPFEAHLSAN